MNALTPEVRSHPGSHADQHILSIVGLGSTHVHLRGGNTSHKARTAEPEEADCGQGVSIPEQPEGSDEESSSDETIQDQNDYGLQVLHPTQNIEDVPTLETEMAHEQEVDQYLEGNNGSFIFNNDTLPDSISMTTEEDPYLGMAYGNERQAIGGLADRERMNVENGVETTRANEPTSRDQPPVAATGRMVASWRRIIELGQNTSDLPAQPTIDSWLDELDVASEEGEIDMAEFPVSPPPGDDYLTHLNVPHLANDDDVTMAYDLEFRRLAENVADEVHNSIALGPGPVKGIFVEDEQ